MPRAKHTAESLQDRRGQTGAASGTGGASEASRCCESSNRNSLTMISSCSLCCCVVVEFEFEFPLFALAFSDFKAREIEREREKEKAKESVFCLGSRKKKVKVRAFTSCLPSLLCVGATPRGSVLFLIINQWTAATPLDIFVFFFTKLSYHYRCKYISKKKKKIDASIINL